MQLDSLSGEELEQLVEMYQKEMMGMGSRRKNFTDGVREKLEQLGFIDHVKGVYYLTVDAERAVKQYLKDRGEE